MFQDVESGDELQCCVDATEYSADSDDQSLGAYLKSKAKGFFTTDIPNVVKGTKKVANNPVVKAIADTGADILRAKGQSSTEEAAKAKALGDYEAKHSDSGSGKKSNALTIGIIAGVSVLVLISVIVIAAKK